MDRRFSRGAIGAVAILAVGGLVLLIVVIVSPASGSSGAITQWTWSHSNDGGQIPVGIFDVSCASPGRCVAVGSGMALRTENGGSTWSANTRGLVGSGAVSCPTVTDCVVVSPSANSERTTNGGVSWVTGGAIQNGYSVDCPTATTCVAVGSDISVTWNGGVSWRNIEGPTDSQYSFVACASASVCVATGSGDTNVSGENGPARLIRTTDGGRVWRDEVLPAPVAEREIAQVSCVSIDCVAVGPQNLVLLFSEDAGASWRARGINNADIAPRPKGSLVLDDATCTSAIRCLAFVSDQTASSRSATLALTTDDAGRSWSSRPLGLAGPGGSGIFAPMSIECSSTTNCMAVSTDYQGDSVVIVTDDGGLEWHTSVTTDYTNTAYSDLACPTTSECWAVGFEPGSWSPRSGLVTSTTEAGAEWNDHDYPVGFADLPQLNSIACPTASVCVSTGDTTPLGPIGIWTDDGGATWRPSTFPRGVTAAGPVQCLTASTCVDVASVGTDRDRLLESLDGGASWTVLRSQPTSRIAGIWCHVVCFAFGASAGRQVLLRSSPTLEAWVATAIPGDVGTLAALSCPTRTECFAAGASRSGRGFLLRSVDGGGAWRPLAELGFASSLTAIACPSTTRCEVAAQVGASLSPQCPLVRSCAIVRGAPAPHTELLQTDDAGARWTVVPYGMPKGEPYVYEVRGPVLVRAIASIVCPSVTVCFAAGTYRPGSGMLFQTT